MAPLPALRPLREDDAELVLGYLRAINAEEHPGVFRRTVFPSVEDERGWLRSRSGDDGAAFAAMDGAAMVGLAECQRPRPAQLRHAAALGISVLRAYQRRGIGRALMRELVGWAAAKGLRRLELDVTADNAPAIALYRDLGFVVEGTKRGAVRRDDGFVDLVGMALCIDPVGG